MSRKNSLTTNEVKNAIKARKQAEKRAKEIYKAQIKEMRPYLKKLRKIDLRKNIGSGEKSYVTKAWKEYQELTSRPFKIYRSKSKTKINIAQAYSRHDNKAAKFDVAFVPTADPKAKLKFKKDRLEVKSKYVTETVLFFDLKNLAENTSAEINRVLNKNKDAKQFIIMAGKYLYNGGLARSLVEGRVSEMMSRYSPGGAGYEKRGENSRWQNWLFGLVAFEATNQSSINEYRQAYHKASNAVKKAKRNVRRARGRKYGEKF